MSGHRGALPVLLMGRSTLPKSVIETLQAAGATEEMISAARVAFVAYEDGYRAKTAARQRAFRARRRNVTRNEATQCDAAPPIERNVTPDGRNLRVRLLPRERFRSLARFFRARHLPGTTAIWS
jgi:hypothetical protein